MPNEESDFRPAWLDYWNRSAHGDEWPEVNPNWQKAEHEHGIGFYAPWEEVYAGFPEHARRCAIALASTDIPVHLRSSRGGMQFQTSRDVVEQRAFDAMRRQLSPLVDASIKHYDAEVWQIIGDESAIHKLGSATHHWMPEAHLRAVQSRRIISTVFERDRVSDDAAHALARVAEVWVANRQDQEMLQEHGVERVRVIPIPYFPSDPHIALSTRKRLAGVPRFYHIGKWEPRKEQRNILIAFLRAFRPGEAKLFMKTSASSPPYKTYPHSPDKVVHEALAEDAAVQANGWSLEAVGRNIIRIQRRLSEEQLLQLHRQGDVYVTLSRGEGFDMPAFDAKLSGNLMVFTPSGGPQDFHGSYDVIVPSKDTVPCDPWYRWPRGSRYLDYKLDDAVAALRTAAATVQAGKGRREIEHLERFRAKRVASQMRDAIEDVKGRVEGKC